MRLAVIFLWSHVHSILWLIVITVTTTRAQQHQQQLQDLQSFSSSAEGKMNFNLTIIHHDILLFAALDANVNRNEFGVDTIISFEAAHSYLLLHDLLGDMCARGGEVFRRVVFELDGYSCIGFLHEMFVASIIGSQHHDKKRFHVLAAYATDAARVVLFQSRYNAYQHVIQGELDWRYVSESAGAGAGAGAAGGGSKGALEPDVITGVPATAVLLVISEDTLCAVLATESGGGEALSAVLQEALLQATLYWDRLSLYIGYDACSSLCLSDTVRSNPDRVETIIRKRLESFVAHSIPIQHLRSVHIKEYALEECYLKEISRLLLFDLLARSAFQNIDDDFHNYEYFILLHDTPSGPANVPLRGKARTTTPTFSSSSLAHIFSELERTTPDTLISRVRSPFSVFVALAASCAHSFETVANCCHISHIRLPRSLLAVYDGHLVPSDMQDVMVKSFLPLHSHSPRPTSALSSLALYLQELLRPFDGVTFFVAHNDEDLKKGTALATPPLSYLRVLIHARTQFLQALRQQKLDLFLDTASQTQALSSQALSSQLRLPSEYHELKLLLNPDLILYGPLDIHYSGFSREEECTRKTETEARRTNSLLAPPVAPPLLAPRPFATPQPEAKIAFFTTILGDYETSCPKVIRQKQMMVDFICFTNSPLIIDSALGDDDNQWIIDEYPYHLDADIWSQIDHESSLYVNSVFDDVMSSDSDGNINSNREKVDYYNLVKFYKMNFYLFPRMKQYDYVVWLDGTIEVHSETAALTISNKLQVISTKGFHVMLFEHTRNTLEYEARASSKDKRWAASTSSLTNNDRDIPPKNGVMDQLQTYHQMGYNESEWETLGSGRPLYGLWVTCFVAYDMRDASTKLFLQSWYTHTQMFSSQCQMSFSFLSQRNLILSERAGVPFRPYSLPDGDLIRGTNRVNTLFRKKRYHGATSI